VRCVSDDAEALRDLLDAAQEPGWPKYIDNPFEDPSPRSRAKHLSHVLERLNRGQVDRHVHFGVHEKGQQFTWSAVD